MRYFALYSFRPRCVIDLCGPMTCIGIGPVSGFLPLLAAACPESSQRRAITITKGGIPVILLVERCQWLRSSDGYGWSMIGQRSLVSHSSSPSSKVTSPRHRCFYADWCPIDIELTTHTPSIVNIRLDSIRIRHSRVACRTMAGLSAANMEATAPRESTIYKV